MDKKKAAPSVAEMKALRAACPSIRELDNKIEREEEKKNSNIELIFDKKKRRKTKN